MLVVISKHPNADRIVTNGTGSLIDTGSGQYLVTNDHVYGKFLEQKAVCPDTLLVMSGAHGRPFRDISQAELRGRDTACDIAVLCIPVAKVHEQGKRFPPATPWPPCRPETGLPAVVYGYPGQGRVLQNGILGLRALSLLFCVATVSDNNFKLSLNEDAERLTPEGVEPLTSIAGMSGSAVYVNSAKTGHAPWYLAGLLFEASDALGIITVSYADHIQADGTVI